MLIFVSIPLAAQALVGSPALLVAVALFAGLCIAPSLTMVTLLVSSNTPSRYATEAFTWSSTCIVSGLGVGNAIGGRLVESQGASAVFVLSGITVACAAICALFVRPRVTAHA